MSNKTAVVKRRALGLGFVVIIIALVALSIAMYNKVFTSVTMVKLATDRVGNQMQEHGDVKVRGLIVGEIRKITPTPDGAVLDLAIDNDKVDLIPQNTTARFIPKTLFGDKYVSLQIPDQSSPTHLRSGDNIAQDHSQKAVELENALDDLLPVLQAVEPQKLSSTLTAISTALQGRGKTLGETLVDLGDLVRQVNPHLPQLDHDLQSLATFSDNVADVSPDLVQALDDLTVTTRTIAEERANLDVVFTSLTTTSHDLESFLRANESNLIALTSTARPVADILARYSPEVPCFLKQMADLVPLGDQLMGKGTGKPGLHATAEIVVNRGKYVPNLDTPKFDDHRGPRCYNFGSTPPQYPPDGPLRDGTSVPAGARTSQNGINPAAGSTGASSASSDGLGIPNSPGERDLLNGLLSAEMDMPPGQVPAWSTLLVGPLFRGAVVDVR